MRGCTDVLAGHRRFSFELRGQFLVHDDRTAGDHQHHAPKGIHLAQPAAIVCGNGSRLEWEYGHDCDVFLGKQCAECGKHCQQRTCPGPQQRHHSDHGFCRRCDEHHCDQRPCDAHRHPTHSIHHHLAADRDDRSERNAAVHGGSRGRQRQCRDRGDIRVGLQFLGDRHHRQQWTGYGRSTRTRQHFCECFRSDEPVGHSDRDAVTADLGDTWPRY
jgi:hypothetical protein